MLKMLRVIWCYPVLYYNERKEIKTMDRKNAWKTYSPAQLQELEQTNEKYKSCLDAGKTDRKSTRLNSSH